jgi:phosphate transport system substrate-binding protein
MNRFVLISVRVFLAIIICVSCEKHEIDPAYKIEGLTLKSFPIMDGSTSTDPLVRIIACKLLGYKYKWEQISIHQSTWNVSTGLPKNFVETHLKSSQTHNSFINLINNDADMIFSARTMSLEEKTYAEERSVSLIETPIALDALIFIENLNNPVNSLTPQQLQDIYAARIKNWKEVGGIDTLMFPLVRNKNSGSQELFETLVLPGELIADDFLNQGEESHLIGGMIPIFSSLETMRNGIGYTVFYYKENIIRDLWSVKTLAVNGVYPDKSTIKSREYPYTAEVYIIIRSDLDKSSIAYKIYELMQTEAGKRIIEESGYVPN